MRTANFPDQADQRIQNMNTTLDTARSQQATNWLRIACDYRDHSLNQAVTAHTRQLARRAMRSCALNWRARRTQPAAA